MGMILFICNPSSKKEVNIQRELAYSFHILSHFWSKGFSIMNPNPFAMGGGRENILTISSELQFSPYQIKTKKCKINKSIGLGGASLFRTNSKYTMMNSEGLWQFVSSITFQLDW